MTNQELKRMEKSLTRSAKKARKYWVRGMIGLTEGEQGFFSIESIPVYNPIRKTETVLKEVFEDIGDLNNRHEELKLSHESLEQELKSYKQEQVELQNQNKIEMDALALRLQELEAFKID